VRQLAHELGQFGITVNTVAPGFLRTSPDYEPQWEGWGPEGRKQFVERIAMRRMGTPEDIAHAVMFLGSDYAFVDHRPDPPRDGIAELAREAGTGFG
jgi:3-oxoacyl-[acyl-carrier protein] reductase